MVDLQTLMYKLRYGTDEEIKHVVKEFINENLEKGTEEAKRLLRRFFLALMNEPRSRIQILVLEALSETHLWDTEVLEAIYEIARNSHDPAVRDAAEKTLLSLLKNAKDKKQALKDIIRAIDKRKVLLSPIDVVKAVGKDVADELIKSGELQPTEVDLLEFAIKELEKES